MLFGFDLPVFAVLLAAMLALLAASVAYKVFLDSTGSDTDELPPPE